MRLCLVGLFLCDYCGLLSLPLFIRALIKIHRCVHRWWWVRESKLVAPCRGLHEKSLPLAPPPDVAMEINTNET